MRRRIDLAVGGRDIRDEARLAMLGEKVGLGGVWFSEVNGPDAVTQAATVGAATRSGRVGTAIVPIQTRDPFLMAQTANSLSLALGGRFILGLGTSTKVVIEDWHSQPWGKPVTGMREYVTLLRRFLAGERVTSDEGDRFHFRRASIAGQRAEKVPIYLAGLNDRMLELAGELGDGVLLNFVGPNLIKHARERIAVGAERSGRTIDDLEIMCYYRCSIVDDFEEVRQRFQQEMLQYALAPVYQKMFALDGLYDTCKEVERLWGERKREEALAAVSDDLIRSRMLAGTYDEVSAQLKASMDAGLDSVMVLPVPSPSRDYVQHSELIIDSLGAIARGY